MGASHWHCTVMLDEIKAFAFVLITLSLVVCLIKALSYALLWKLRWIVVLSLLSADFSRLRLLQKRAPKLLIKVHTRREWVKSFFVVVHFLLVQPVISSLWISFNTSAKDGVSQELLQDLVEVMFNLIYKFVYDVQCTLPMPLTVPTNYLHGYCSDLHHTYFRWQTLMFKPREELFGTDTFHDNLRD